MVKNKLYCTSSSFINNYWSYINSLIKMTQKLTLYIYVVLIIFSSTNPWIHALQFFFTHRWEFFVPYRMTGSISIICRVYKLLHFFAGYVGQQWLWNHGTPLSFRTNNTVTGTGLIIVSVILRDTKNFFIQLYPFSVMNK